MNSQCTGFLVRVWDCGWKEVSEGVRSWGGVNRAGHQVPVSSRGLGLGEFRSPGGFSLAILLWSIFWVLSSLFEDIHWKVMGCCCCCFLVRLFTLSFLLFSEVSSLRVLLSCWFISILSLRLQVFFKGLAILCCHFIYQKEGLVSSSGLFGRAWVVDWHLAWGLPIPHGRIRRVYCKASPSIQGTLAL